MKKQRKTRPTASAPVPPPRPPPTLEEIQKRAYELYLARGDAPGNALSDWLQAEHELTQVST